MEIIEGDLTDFPEDVEVIFQQCNVWACMGSGLAKQIRQQFPEAYEADVNYPIEKGYRRYGNYSKAEVGFDTYVVNLYGQDLGKENPLNLKAYMSALEKSLRHFAVAFDRSYDPNRKGVRKKPKLGFPYQICCGLAKGYWPYIKDITEWLVEKHGFEAIWVKYNEE